MTLDHTIRKAYINTLLDGGFTRLADKTINPTEGYIVGGAVEPTTMANPITELALTDVNAHFEGFKKLWHKYDLKLNESISLLEPYHIPEAMGIGTWIHDGQIYFDLVQHIYNLDVATDIAKQRGEIAIYDCKNQKDILL